MAKKVDKKAQAEEFLAKYKNDNKDEMARTLIDRLRQIGEEKKKLTNEEDMIKVWLREYGASKRKGEERSVDIGSGATIAFQSDVPKDMDEPTAKALKEQFLLFFENDGAKMFNDLFEKVVKWKPVSGFGDKLEAYDNATKKKLKALIQFKANTPLVQS